MTKAKTPERSKYARARDKARGGPPRQPQPHGTVAAARRHERAGEDKCAKCAKAWAEHQAAMYQARRVKVAAAAEAEAARRDARNAKRRAARAAA